MSYPQRGIMSLKQSFLNSNMYFAMLFDEGLLFARILHRELSQYKPLAVVDETGTAVNLAAGSASQDIFIRDPRQTSHTVLGGEEMNALYGGRPHVYHAGIGIFPPQMMAYIRYPGKTQALLNAPSNNLPQANPANVDHLGNVDGEESPFYDPTNYSELMIVPGQTPSITFANDFPTSTDLGRDSERVVLNVLQAHYVIDLLKPVVSARDANLSGPDRQRAKADNRLIRKMMMGDLDPIFRFFKIGAGERPISYDSRLQDAWKVTPIGFDEAKGLEEP